MGGSSETSRWKKSLPLQGWRSYKERRDPCHSKVRAIPLATGPTKELQPFLKTRRTYFSPDLFSWLLFSWLVPNSCPSPPPMSLHDLSKAEGAGKRNWRKECKGLPLYPCNMETYLHFHSGWINPWMSENVIFLK